MRYVVAGTAGHIDHGKSELVRALTGINPDRLKEEQERGITIDIGFAHLDLGDVRLAFVDVPGHERFVKNMLAGACGIDMVLLVIAADESIMPQTREHFDICRLLGIRSGIVALTKSDLVDDEIRQTVLMEVDEFLRGTFLQDAPVVSVSSKTGSGLPELREALERVAGRVPVRTEEGVVRLPVDRSFTVRGFGTVVTGTLVSGVLEDGDEAELLPSGRKGRIRGLQVHGEDVARSRAGQRTAVNLQGLSRDEIRRGEVLTEPGALLSSRMVDADVRVLEDSPVPLKDLDRVRFHVGTSEILARARVLGAARIDPGEEAHVQVRLEAPAVVVPGDRFILRRYSPARTIAGGVVLDGAPAKHRRNDRDVLPWLDHLSSATPVERAGIFVEGSGEAGIGLPALAARCGTTQEVIRRAVEDLSRQRRVVLLPAEPPRVVSDAALSGLAEKVLAAVERFHRDEPLLPGIPREPLKGRLHRDGPPEVFRGAVDRLVSEGRLRVDGERLALADHRVELGEAERKIREQIEERLLQAGLDPPALRDVLPGNSDRPSAERILHMLLKEGRLARLPDGRVVHAEALSRLRRKLYRFREKSELIDIASFKDLAGVSRKNAIPLLEHLDSEKVTVRRGNDRFILPER